MITCQYCSHKNEEGTLFCERCKSDLLSLPESKPMSEVISAPETIPVNELPMAEPVAPEIIANVVAQDAAPVIPPHDAETASYTSHQTSPEQVMTGDPPSLAYMKTPKLVVIRGQKLNVEYPIYTGDNYIGRTDERPVDIDLEDQESSERIWCSRQHAKIVSDDGTLNIE